MSFGAQRYKHPDPILRSRESESTHHRRPRSLGGSNESRNTIELPRSKHQSWHNLFYNFTPERIALEINLRYLDPDWQLVAIKRE